MSFEPSSPPVARSRRPAFGPGPHRRRSRRRAIGRVSPPTTTTDRGRPGRLVEQFASGVPTRSGRRFFVAGDRRLPAAVVRRDRESVDIGSGVSQRPVPIDAVASALASRRRSSLATGPAVPVGTCRCSLSDAPSMLSPVTQTSVGASAGMRSDHAGSSPISRVTRVAASIARSSSRAWSTWISTVATENTRVTLDDSRMRPFETACTEPRLSRSNVRRRPISSTVPSTPPAIRR